MSVIFDEDFVLLSWKPASYTIALHPEGSENFDQLLLAVSYPPTYPDVAPTLTLLSNGQQTLHPVQERAVLNAAYDVFTTPGTPCVYGCVIAVLEFLNSGGLVQAGIAMLSDDCLARILSYLSTTVQDVENVCKAMPILREASTTNSVWRPLC